MEHNQHLLGWLKEELADSERYAEAAERAQGFERQFLHDMAHEEFEHARSIWKMMEHEHMTDGLDKFKLFHETHEKVYQ